MELGAMPSSKAALRAGIDRDWAQHLAKTGALLRRERRGGIHDLLDVVAVIVGRHSETP